MSSFPQLPIALTYIAPTTIRPHTSKGPLPTVADCFGLYHYYLLPAFVGTCLFGAFMLIRVFFRLRENTDIISVFSRKNVAVDRSYERAVYCLLLAPFILVSIPKEQGNPRPWSREGQARVRVKKHNISLYFNLVGWVWCGNFLNTVSYYWTGTGPERSQ